MVSHAAIKTAWSGYYVQDGKNEMRFDSFIMDVNTVRGGGEDVVGKFVLAGVRDGNDIEFRKQYIGMHSIGYKGRLVDLDNGNQNIVGEWFFDGPSGDVGPEDDGYFQLSRDLETERRREAAFKMVVARMKMYVGLIRFFLEDLGSSCIQVLFLFTHETTPMQFYFTLASVGACVLMSILGPIAEALNSRRRRLDAGDAAGDPPSVDGGNATTASGKKGGEQEPLLKREEDDDRDEAARERKEAKVRYQLRLEQARSITNCEMFWGNNDYINILMEKPDEPAMVPDVAVTDIIASNARVRRALLVGVTLFWAYALSVPFVFDISCGGAVPADAHLGFLAIASFNLFLQVWCAAHTKFGYLTLTHAPQQFGLNLFLGLLGLFDTYTDIAFVAMLKECHSHLWIVAAALFFVGVFLAQALPGLIFLGCTWYLPAALKLNEMSILLMLLKPSVN